MSDEISEIKRLAGITEGRRFRVYSEEMYDLMTLIRTARDYVKAGRTEDADVALHRATSMASNLLSRS